MFVHRQCQRIPPEALLRDEAFGGIDQFFQVFDPVRAFALAAVMLDEP